MNLPLFLHNCVAAAQQVIILYIIAAVGFAADRLGVFTEKTAKASNDLLFYIITPCVIINSFLTTEFSLQTSRDFLLAALGAAITHILGITLSLPFFNKTKNSSDPVFKFACVYGNMGYMALPLAQAMLGEKGVFYCSAGIIIFQIFCFTHGVWLMSSDNGEKRRFAPKSLLLNPGVISVLIGLPFFLLKVKMPAVVKAPIEFIGSMNTPLAMLMLGTYMSNAGLKTIFKNKEQYLAAAIKIVAVPTVFLLLNKFLGIFSGTLFTACIIQASAPSANNTVMFAAKYGKDTGIASKTVAFISFASVFTMPVMIALTRM